jgi:alpha-L-fucosidase 2
MQIGRNGDLQEWLDDWGQREKSHRHISNLYGLYPGGQISVRRTPELAAASRVVLDQRGLEGNGWSSAWKAASWARLGDGAKALENVVYAVRTYTTASLFSICSRAMQVDGAFGMTAAIAEMLVQSHEDVLDLLPALPAAWRTGAVTGLRARGNFTVDLAWKDGAVQRVEILSGSGSACRVRAATPLQVTTNGRRVATTGSLPGVIEFATAAGERYVLAPLR